MKELDKIDIAAIALLRRMTELASGAEDNKPLIIALQGTAEDYLKHVGLSHIVSDVLKAEDRTEERDFLANPEEKLEDAKTEAHRMAEEGLGRLPQC